MNTNTDNTNPIVRTELWYKIYSIIKQLPTEQTNDDALDAPSATTQIENLLNEFAS